MTTSLAECDVCHDNFDEDQRCPRLLPCNHSVCNMCIRNLIANNKKSCPTCRGPFNENTADELAVNYCAANLIKHINHLKSNAISPDVYYEAPTPKKIDFLKKQAKKILSDGVTGCEKTLELLKQSVQENEVLKDSIESMNKELKENILDKVCAMVNKNDARVKALTNKNDVLIEQQNDLENYHDELIEMREKLSACTSGNYVRIAPILDEVEKSKSDLKRKIDDCKEAISKEPEHHQKQKKITVNATDKGVTGVMGECSTTSANVANIFIPVTAQQVPFQISQSSVLPQFPRKR